MLGLSKRKGESIKWRWLIYSGLIRDLLDVPSQQPIESAPFHLDHDSKIIHIFVHLIYSTYPTNKEISLPEDYQSLVEVCDHFDADPVYTLLSEMVCSQIKIKEEGDLGSSVSWAILKLGIIKSDIRLSRAAIANMDSFDIDDIFCDRSTEGLKRFDGMPPKSVYLLFACVLNGNGSRPSDGSPPISISHNLPISTNALNPKYVTISTRMPKYADISGLGMVGLGNLVSPPSWTVIV
jgi:hypothetical protein